MSNDLPKYHCPDCKDFDCLHCYCVDEPECSDCVEFEKSNRHFKQLIKTLIKGENK